MNTTKKVALSLMVGIMAIGFSAFTSSNGKTLRFSTVYYQVSPGVYSLTPPDDSECNPTTNPCTITFSNTITQPDFTLPNYPAGGGTRTPSQSNGVWQ